MAAELGAVGRGAVLELVSNLAGDEQKAGLRPSRLVQGGACELERGDRAAVAGGDYERWTVGINGDAPHGRLGNFTASPRSSPIPSKPAGRLDHLN
ncbi:hypothetical protein ACIA03_09900 [Nocardioides sp. NPDC051685]|uniref:hypothetical protein n=1 Tax=Nocardioides sp. NPDC051685 TaxID=3364334 RepID=UPI00379F8847